MGRSKPCTGFWHGRSVPGWIGNRYQEALELLQKMSIKAPTITGVSQRTVTGTVKAANVKTSGPMVDSPRNCGDLDAYGLYIRAINTNLDHYGEHTEISIHMELGSFNLHDNPASKNIQNFETFLKDLMILNQIKKADHPGVIEQWEKMQVLLELTKKKDK